MAGRENIKSLSFSPKGSCGVADGFLCVLGSDDLKEIAKMKNLWNVVGTELQAMLVSHKERCESLKAFHESFEESRQIKKATNEVLVDKLDRMVFLLTTIGNDINKGYKEELTQIQNYEDTEARELERAINQSVMDYLEDSKLLLSRYTLKGEGQIGDVDGIVVGKLDGQEVVVLIESKHSLATKGMCVKANRQLKTTADHWDELRRTDAFLGEGDALDSQNFCIQEHAGRKIILAYGAFEFPDQSAKYFEQTREHPTWLIRNNVSKKFVVHPIGLRDQIRTCRDGSRQG